MFSNSPSLFLLFCGTCLRRLQSSSPPRVVFAGDPLTRWSSHLLDGWPAAPQLRLPHCDVGLEGCTSAFNALNAIRTCMHFGTKSPPHFLSLSDVSGIRSLHPRCGGRAGDETATLQRVAHFGPFLFDAHSNPPNRLRNDVRAGQEETSPCRGATLPMVVLENYVPRAESLLRRRFPSAARLVVGHENHGVSPERVHAAEEVLYVPQYGTISSLNVVTSLGIALFYAWMDSQCPTARDVTARDVSTRQMEFAALLAYHSRFRAALPACHGDRLDSRPIHPNFYSKDVRDIVAMHSELRQLLLRVVGRESTGRFGLTILCENESDQRSLGGIVRSANAFLVDAVCYYGRRRINTVGTVGTRHYTSPVYVAPSYSASDTTHWEQTLNHAVSEKSGKAARWWLLDCGQAMLYQTGSSMIESLRCFAQLQACGQTLVLSEAEETLRGQMADGVVLVVPPEGSLPPPCLLRRCAGVVSIMPRNAHGAGLPVPVAAGIAMQRIGAIMHPQLQGL